MAIIIDPDLLRQSTVAATGVPDGEVFINPATSTIELISTTDGATPFAASNLIAADGVSLQALYSFLKEQWKTDTNLIKYPFPMEAITSEQFEFINDWELDDTTTASRTYIRFGGWQEKDSAAVVKREYLSAISLGTFAEPTTQKAYYYWAGDTSRTEFTYFGPVNEAIQSFGDATNGNFDNRALELTIAIRPTTTGVSGSVVGYTYNESTTTAIGALTVTYQAYRFPLSSVVDLALTLTDAEIVALDTAKTFTIDWFASPTPSNLYLSPDLNGGPYNFEVVIDNVTENATPSEVYNFVQYQLRQGNVDIDDGTGTQFAFSTPALVVFVGSVLETFDIDSDSAVLGGVLVGGIDSNQAANFKMRDNAGTLQVFPAIAAGSLVFNTNLIEDANTKYWLFFDNAGGNTYPGTNAVIVQNFAGTPIEGDLHNSPYTVATGSNTGSDGAVTAGGFTFTSAGQTWTVDDLAGQVLRIDAGTNINNYFIVSNTATTLTVERAFEETESTITYDIASKNTTGSIPWDFAYTNNVQGGRTGGTDAPVSVVALGRTTGQYVLAAGNTILNASGQNFSVTAALERNFSDPV